MMLKPLATLALAVALAGCAAERPGAPSAAAPARMPFAIDRLSEVYEGTAREVLQVSGYTYVAVDTGAGTRWAVSLRKELDEGARVRVRAFGKRSAFESKQLGRTFDELWFAIVTPVTEGASS